MFHLLRLINSHFWKSYFGPFFAFIFPLILLGLLGSILGYYDLFSGVLAIPSTAVALISMPTAIFQFKNSVLFKRIGITNIKPYQFILCLGFYYFFIMFFATFWCILFTIIFFNSYWDKGITIENSIIHAPALKEFFQKANWGGFIFGLSVNIIVGVSLGMFLLTICKNMLALQAIGTTIMILNQFLASQVLPVSMINEIHVIKILSYFSPFRYSTALIIESMMGNWALNIVDTPVRFYIESSNNIFNVHQEFYTFYNKSIKKLIFATPDKIANLVAPFAFTIVFSALSVKSFKWMVR